MGIVIEGLMGDDIPRRYFEPEAPPLFSLVFAAAASAVLIFVAPAICLPVLMRMLPTGENVGPLALPVFVNPMLEPPCGAAFLTLISLALLAIEQVRPFPVWLPMALSFPIICLLILPSALEHGGTLLSWLAFGGMLTALFCLHWGFLAWARGVWD